MKKFSLVFLSLLFLSGLCFTDETEMDSLSAVNDFQVLIASSRGKHEAPLASKIRPLSECLIEKYDELVAVYVNEDLK